MEIEKAASHPTSKPSILISGLLRWAELAPNRIALDDGTNSLTFGQLRKRVEVLGTILINRLNFVGDNRVLPILVDRTIESTVAVLSCLYAGIAFSPIDSDLPEERTLHLLDRLQCKDYLLATPNSRIPAFAKSSTVILSNERGESVQKPTLINPSAIGLVLFTSGSTGSPKGVVFDWSGFEEGVYKEDTFPNDDLSLMRHGVTGPIHFSGGLVRQLTVSLGISVFILNPIGISQAELLRRVRDLNISLFALPPSLIKSLGQLPESSDLRLPAVTRLEIGTEGIRYEDLASIARFFGENLKIFHGLGATEASCKIGQTFKLIDAPKTGQVPLGVPYMAEKAWLKPLSDGSSDVCEILFGGDLAKEYLDDPILTQQRFVFDENGRRWWRSGDLVSVDDEGTYWHRGRTDDLVKIRGKLASPSEVMQILSSIEGIRSSVVLPHESGGSTRFIAHIVLVEGSTLTAWQVRRRLALALPSHLVPAVLMLHQQLPLNLNQKIDRVGLQTGDIIPWRDIPFILPNTPIEGEVLMNVKIVLDLEEFSVNDDIWEYGLDSLSAIELITRLESSATNRLTIDDLLTNRTVNQIAKQMKSTFLPPVEIVSMNENGTRAILFAIPGVGGFATHYAYLASALGEDQPLTIFPDVSFTVKELSIESEAIRISSLIEKTQSSGGISIAGFSAGGVLALEIARQLVSRNRKVNLLLIDAGIQHYSIGSGIETFYFDSAGNYKPSYSPLDQKIATIKSILDLKRLRSSMSVITNIFFKKYLQPKYNSILFFVSREKFPQGMKRFYFLAARKQLLRNSYVATPVECQVSYFSVKNNLSPIIWKKLFPDMKIVEVQGDHVTMLHPPFVTGTAEQIRKNLEAFVDSEQS